ncbi:putative homeobox-leucine zipper protein ATHB-12-like [Capsicum annuum]|nr:putative homeobox-leucine zipper protein ATHB-12-like [Capsicum annuum]
MRLLSSPSAPSVNSDGLAPSPSPSTSSSLSRLIASPHGPFELIFTDPTSKPTVILPTIPAVDGISDLADISLVLGILFLSLFSFALIFHLRIRSRQLPHLQNFNSLWVVRLLLVFFACLGAVNEVIRLPFIRQKYLYPLLPSLSLDEQAEICKVHVVLSLGFFEPGFLITLLFLVNESIKTQNPFRTWGVALVCLACSPILLLQSFFVFFPPLEAKLPPYIHASFYLSTDQVGNKSVLCTYPMFSCVAFGVFSVAYSLAFLLSCWRVVAFVINKKIRVRLNMLATSFMILLPLQILCLGLSALWPPAHPTHEYIVLAMDLAFAWCVVIGEVILVIKPIADALDAGGACFAWSPGSRSGCPRSEGKRVDNGNL